MSEIDRTEYANLEKAVLAVERVQSSSGGSVAFPGMLGDFVRNARERMATLETSGVLSVDSERKREERENGAIAVLIERETRLTAAERQQYGSFLEKEFFTRGDFAALDDFYGSGWDRLTDEGKDQMSHRVWNGIREGEYSFAELPENVREKEAERLYALLGRADQMPENLRNIPEQDREDFKRAYESGNQQTVDQVLSRDSFTENVATGSSSTPQSREPDRSTVERDHQLIEELDNAASRSTKVLAAVDVRPDMTRDELEGFSRS